MHLIQTSVKLIPAVRHAEAVGLPHTAATDQGVIIKTALTEALGGPVVRPWMVVASFGGTATIAGYSNLDAAALNDRRALALPTLQAAVGEFMSAPLPTFAVGQMLDLSMRAVPRMHVTGQNGDQDAAAVLMQRGDAHDREAAYRTWLDSKARGCRVEAMRLAGWHREKAARRSHAGATGWRRTELPIAQIHARVRVDDPATFTSWLAEGIGGHRAYGYGMLRVRPVAVAAA